MLYYLPLDPMPDVPVPNHYGAFGVKRRHDVHRGVDLYTKVGDCVYAIESGVVVLIDKNFTGTQDKTPWWNDTQAIYIEGNTGVFCYGEILLRKLTEKSYKWKLGDSVMQGDRLGSVLQVLKKDKGKPMSMLHIELHRHGLAYRKEHNIYDMQLDPTLVLMQCACKGRK